MGYLHIYFVPTLGHGHMIPCVDMARVFARRGVKATIVLTTQNAALFSKTIERDRELGLQISIRSIKFPSEEVGLPEVCESKTHLLSKEMFPKVFRAIDLLQQPFEELLEEERPDCLVADAFLPWATDVASKFGIPRLVFHGTNAFALCVHHVVHHQEPFKNTEPGKEDFVVPGLPHRIKLTKGQLPDFMRNGTGSPMAALIEKVFKAGQESYGAVINSFLELEPAYAEYYRKVVGRKAWHIGPVSLCNRDNEDKAHRGNVNSIDDHECLAWLASKKPNSVLYVCFGSISSFSTAQLLEIAMALEASGQQFIWVAKKEKEEEGREEWLPDGFEKRLEGGGLIVRGWAPQVLILDHEAIGGFMTHCGWNSMLEGLTAGVPMITWPLFAEQFYNEKLATDVLRVGVGVGAQDWCRWPDEKKIHVNREDIETAVTRVMVGEEAEDIRSRAQAVGDMARKAVEEGGSSFSDLSALLDELKLNCQ